MKRIQRSSSPRAIRLISLALCYSLIVTTSFLPLTATASAGAQGSNHAAGSSSRFVLPAGILGAPGKFWASLITLLQGGGGLPSVPGPNLPDLDAARTAQPSEPVAPEAIPSNQACTDCAPCPTCGPGSVNHTPGAQAGGPYYGTVGASLVISGLDSFDVDPGDSIDAYAWNFGDGTGVFAGSSPVHTYAAAGNYTISLTVTDSHNATAMASATASITAAPPSVPPSGTTQGNAALFIAQTVPTTMTAGQSYPVSVTMRNTGTTTWSAAHLYRLGAENPLDNSLWGTSRIHLPTTVAPGADVTFNFTVIAPYSGADEPPAAQFQWRMVQEFVQWFDTATPSQTVTIISNYQSGNPGVPQYGPFSNLFASRIAPEHRTGQAGEDLLSGNYNWGLGLVGLAGRSGLNLNLGLAYNSMAAWTKVVPAASMSGRTLATSFTFDADRGFPSAGFRLGFPTIQGPFTNMQTGGSSYLLLMPTGGRVELRRVGATNVYEAADSSYLQLVDGGNGSLLLRTTDGTQMAYWSINSEYRCTEVKDRNGNYLTIKYDPINGITNLGRMTSIIDTLGRTLNFNYDTNYRLQSITQLRNGQTHVWASFGYTDKLIATNFINSSSGPVPVVLGLPTSHIVSVLSQVGLDDGSRYNFEYNSWGQVNKITHNAADSTSGSPHPLTYVSYNLPQSNSTGQTDCPHFTQRQDWAENWNNNNAVTTNFQIDPNGTSGEVTTAAGTPDQVTYKEFFTTDYSDWRRGLVTRTEIITPNPTTLRKTTVTDRTQDATNVAYPLNPRPTAITISDAEGKRRRTTIEYGAFGLPSEVYEQGPYGTNDWRTLRRTHTDYNFSDAYVNRRIIGLVAGQYLFGPDANGYSIQTLLSKTTMEHDAGGEFLADQSNPLQHDAAYGLGFVQGRGNVTSARRRDINYETDIAHSTASTVGYNTNGSAIFSRDSLGHAGRQTTMSYTDSFSSNGINTITAPGLTLAYPTSVTDPENFSSTAKYNYDLGVATRQQDPKGAAQTTEYDSTGRVKRITNAVNGAYTRFVYPTSQTIVNKFTTVNELTIETYSATVFDGAGRVRAVAGDFPDNAGNHYSGQFTLYDQQGRAVQSTNPTEMNHAWAAAGADAGWYSILQTYDWKGRPLKTTNPSITSDPSETTTKEASYDGCGCAGGAVATLTDEGTVVSGVEKKRQQKIYSDPLGRTVKTEILNWAGGSVYSTTVNSYNARDQVTTGRQYQGTEASGVYQETAMTYDGYGRLQTKHLPQQAIGTASTWTYFDDDTVKIATDARGASATYTYNDRGLVKTIAYDPSAGVPDTPSVAFNYDDAGNRISMTDGLGSVGYTYNTLSEMTSETRIIDGVGTFPIVYDYHPGGQLKKITDPMNGSINYVYDNAGRTSTVTGSDTLYGGVSNYASNFKYRAWGGLKNYSFENNHQYLVSLTYTNRMQVSRYELKYTVVNTAIGGAEYQYEPDGRLRSSVELNDTRHQRAYTYDQAARLTQALTGAEARGEAPAPGSDPFKQNYAYNAWDNLTSRTGHHWGTLEPAFTANYVNNRNTNPQWQYNADGDVLQQVNPQITRQYLYDAAGRQISMTEPPRRPNRPTLTLTQDYDGDGQRVKYVQNNVPLYEIRSSVLGSRVITEVDAQGAKKTGFVYANGGKLAKQSLNEVAWVNEAPDGSGEWAGATRSLELDPLGNDVGVDNPYDTGDGLGDYPVHGDPADFDSGCMYDGGPIICDVLNRYVLARQNRYDRLAELNNRTPPIVPSTINEITWLTLVRDALEGTPFGDFLYPKSEKFWRYINPFVPPGTLYANPQNTSDPCAKLLPANIPPGVNIDENIRTAEGLYRQATRPIADLGGTAARGSQPLVTFMDFYNRVKTDGPWDYKQLDKEGLRLTGHSKYEEFGNFNFGATGAAERIPTGALLRGGGLAQQRDANPEVRAKGQGVAINSWPEIFSNKGTYPYGDEPSDSEAIQRGVDYYNCRRANPR